MLPRSRSIPTRPENSHHGNCGSKCHGQQCIFVPRSPQWSVAQERKYYCVYIMGSLRGTLYIGVGGNLHRRVFQHKFHHFEGFTDRYDVTRLLYWESYDEVHKALGRETKLKGWTRAKKIALIVRRNPHWVDLAAEWYPWMKPEEGRDASTPQ